MLLFCYSEYYCIEKKDDIHIITKPKMYEQVIHKEYLILSLLTLLKTFLRAGMVVHTYNPS
jgi:hypothetical protein